MDTKNILNSVKNMKEQVKDKLKDINIKAIKKDSIEENYPQLDMIDSVNTLSFIIELPGVKKENIKLSLSGDKLHINIEKKPTIVSDDNQTHIIKELKYGNFTRTINLPCKIQENTINTNFEDGVLHIVLYKIQEEQKEIKIS